MSIEVRNITKSFGKFVALRDVSLTVNTGELVALLGPSGSGKTTLLRVIAGLEQPDPSSGPILFHQEDVAQQRVGERGVGFVFQHYALFRHMTVFENIAFGLRVRPRRLRPSRMAIRRRVLRLLKLVQLDFLADRYPNQLSGGQRQRVALARALAMEPKILLLDEPFGALDAKVRQELRRWLRRLHDELHVTSVFVTHDQEEALELADRVVVMNAGRIEQIGTPDEVFHHPRTEFVMDFLGQVNRFQGRMEGGRVHFAQLSWPAPEQAQLSSSVLVFIRPHDLQVFRDNGPQPSLQARVTHIHSAGPNVRLELLAASGERLFAELTQERYRELAPTVGDEVYLTPRDVKLFATPPPTELD
jgi:sulfate transport system ATP-binding protein